MKKYSLADKEHMRLHVEDWSRSGMTISGYCKDHSIKEHVFHYWKKQYHVNPKEIGSFVPLPIASPSTTSVIEILLPSGIRIRFSNLAPIEYIKSLCCI